MNIETKEFDPMQLSFTVTPELGQGYGKITAANRVSDEEARERAMEQRQYIEQISPDVPVGCIDGRGVLRTLEGKESKLGGKTAGGAAITGLLTLEVEDAFGDEGNIYQHLARTIDMLESGSDEEKVRVRFHVDEDNEEKVRTILERFRQDLAEVHDIDDFIEKVRTSQIDEKGSGCGMGDQFFGAASNLARLPRTYEEGGVVKTETEEQVTRRLDFIKTTSAAIVGDSFSESKFDEHVDGATKLVEGRLKEWDSLKALVVADRVLSDLGARNGIMSRLEVLQTSPDGVHGHIEDEDLVNKRENTTFNQTRYFEETKRKVFAYDEWIAPKIANRMAASLTRLQEVHTGIIQGVTETNIAGAFQLADGTQRAVIFN